MYYYDHQLTLNFQPHPSYNRDDFLISTCNQDAYRLVSEWPLKWGHAPYPYTALIHGPKSSGKTYVAKIWQAASMAYDIKSAQNNEQTQNPRQNQNQQQKSSPKTILSETLFTENLSDISAFIIEDIEKWDEQILLHWFNKINESQKFLLLTSGQKYHKFTLPDLSSRIYSLHRVEISAPDDDILKMLIFKIFSSKSIKIAPHIVDYLLLNLPRQFSEIISVIEQLDIAALAGKRPITIPFIKQILKKEPLYK